EGAAAGRGFYIRVRAQVEVRRNVKICRSSSGDIGLSAGRGSRATELDRNLGRVARLRAIRSCDHRRIRAEPVAAKILYVGAWCRKRATRLTIDDLPVPVTAQIVV